MLGCKHTEHENCIIVALQKSAGHAQIRCYIQAKPDTAKLDDIRRELSEVVHSFLPPISLHQHCQIAHRM